MDDSAHYQWSRYRHNALGQPDPRITPHPLYASIAPTASTNNARQTAYRALFRTVLDDETINDIRLALNQNQLLGNNRFHNQIKKKFGDWREARPRGRPRLAETASEVQSSKGRVAL